MLGEQVAQKDYRMMGGERQLEQGAGGDSLGAASSHLGRETGGVSVDHRCKCTLERERQLYERLGFWMISLFRAFVLGTRSCCRIFLSALSSSGQETWRWVNAGPAVVTAGFAFLSFVSWSSFAAFQGQAVSLDARVSSAKHGKLAETLTNDDPVNSALLSDILKGRSHKTHTSSSLSPLSPWPGLLGFIWQTRNVGQNWIRKRKIL